MRKLVEEEAMSTAVVHILQTWFSGDRSITAPNSFITRYVLLFPDVFILHELPAAVDNPLSEQRRFTMQGIFYKNRNTAGCPKSSFV